MTEQAQLLGYTIAAVAGLLVASAALITLAVATFTADARRRTHTRHAVRHYRRTR